MLYDRPKVLSLQHNTMEISAYILTCNSERYIEEILTQLSKFADEVVVLDSGSTDATLERAARFPSVSIYHRPFDNFKEQRNYAASLCRNDTVFYVDSDEIPDDTLVNALFAIKAEMTELGGCGYAVSRQWYVMGRRVHSIYPVESPDHVIRLFDRRYISFDSHSTLVHETLGGQSETRLLDGSLIHRTFHTRQEMKSKLEQYTTLAAQDLIQRKGKVRRIKVLSNPIAAFVKWYFFKRGFLDGQVGLMTGCYAYRYTWLKYRKALQMMK